MKKTKFALQGLQIGLVTDYDSSSRGMRKHGQEYQIFNLKHPVQNVGLVGVTHGDVFALSVSAEFSERYGVAMYVDGVNVDQKSGILSIADIAESRRSNYDAHRGFIGATNYPGKIAYLDKFNQSSGQNRMFTFTLDEAKGVNYNTINDPSQMSKIEIYFWKERTPSFGHMVALESNATRGGSRGATKSAVGAGQATNKAYGSTHVLRNPEYLGKVVFVHVPVSAISHLGAGLIASGSAVSAETFSVATDPMDHVPRS